MEDLNQKLNEEKSVSSNLLYDNSQINMEINQKNLKVNSLN